MAEQLVKQAEDRLDWPDAIAGQNCSDLWIDLFDLHLNMTNKQKKNAHYNSCQRSAIRAEREN